MKRNLVRLLILLPLAVTALSGCTVVFDGGWHHHHYWR